MADMDSLDYLQAGFDPASLTVPRLRSILVQHDITYPASAKKADLISIFETALVPQARKILAARARARRTSKGITDADSQDSIVDEEAEELMPPPPTPRVRGRATKTPSKTPAKQPKIKAEESESDVSVSRSPVRRTPRPSTKYSRLSDSETGMALDEERTIRKTRKSEPTASLPVAPISLLTPLKRESLNKDKTVFSKENPFQSGSSPPSGLKSDEKKRRSASTGKGRDSSVRKSSSTTRRRTEQPKITSVEDIPTPSHSTFEVLVSDIDNGVRSVDENGVEASEEFTPEEQWELIQEKSALGLDAVGTKRPKRSQSRGISKSGPLWLIFFTLLAGYVTWYRQEKVAVGYCGVGRDAKQIIPSDFQVPDWLRLLVEPECELCPQHAYCSLDLETQCEQDFVLKSHPLSMGGLVPLLPTCEPDGEKVLRVKAVADRAVEELRERRAQWECGDLLDSAGLPEPTVEIAAEELKKEVSKKKRKGMGEAEFEELWAGALGEIKGREEVQFGPDGHSLTSTSLARLPFTCAVRRTLRLTLARHRLQISVLVLSSLLALYIRYLVRARAAVTATIPSLVSTTLSRLAAQATLYAQDPESVPEPYIPIGQLRDDVLRSEHSISKREHVWSRVQKVVEMNSNVRASQREARNGEISRVWEWIGALGAFEDGVISSGDRRRSGRSVGRVSWGSYDERSSPVSGHDAGLEKVQANWKEGRPIY